MTEAGQTEAGQTDAGQTDAPQTVGLTWTPTPLLRRLVLIAALTVVGAFVTAHGELLVLAAVPLVLLVSNPRSRLPETARLSAHLDPRRCVEGDPLTLEVTVVATGVDRVEAEVVLPPHTEMTYDGVTADGPERDSRRVRWTLRPQRWGRYRVGPVRLRLLAAGGSYLATVEVAVAEIVVYPAAAALHRAVAPRELAAPLGEHPSRARGSGVEFAGVRPYAAGDRRRDVDWRTSARHGELFVRQYAAERAFDLVLVLDTGSDAGEPGSSTLDLTVRVATGLASSYLQAHDRVGVITFGGPLHWLAPGTGPRHLYQVYEALMSVRPDEYERDAGSVSYGLENLPTRMLPHHAFVALVSPLLDDRALDAVKLLRDRGFAPLVVDVLTSEPEVRPGTAGALALRTWRLQREALTVELASLGVPVVAYDGEGDLSAALMHTMRALRPEVRA